MTLPRTLPDQYQALRRRGITLAREGRYENALEVLEQAGQMAERIGDPDLVDRALCNVAAVRIEYRPGSCDDLLPRLRDVLVRDNSPESCRLAAYHLARAYEWKDDYKKGLFYARIALERTKALVRQHEKNEWLATSYNQIGNLLAADSFFAEAIEQFEGALTVHPEPPAVFSAMVERNIGYCRVMLGDVLDGTRHLLRSYRCLRKNKWLSTDTHLLLSFAYIELEKYRHALRHALSGLATAEELGQKKEQKNALYLLGEACVQMGDEERARQYFSKLQRFYPNTPFIADLLLATDVRHLINLRA